MDLRNSCTNTTHHINKLILPKRILGINPISQRALSKFQNNSHRLLILTKILIFVLGGNNIDNIRTMSKLFLNLDLRSYHIPNI